MQVTKHASKGIHFGFEMQGRRHRSPTQGYQRPHKKYLCPPNFLMKGFVPSIYRLIKMSSPNINNIILIGCIIMYVSVFVQEQSEHQVRSFCRVSSAYFQSSFFSVRQFWQFCQCCVKDLHLIIVQTENVKS